MALTRRRKCRPQHHNRKSQSQLKFAVTGAINVQQSDEIKADTLRLPSISLACSLPSSLTSAPHPNKRGAGNLRRLLHAAPCCAVIIWIVHCVTIQSPTCPEGASSGYSVSRPVNSRVTAPISCVSVAAARRLHRTVPALPSPTTDRVDHEFQHTSSTQGPIKEVQSGCNLCWIEKTLLPLVKVLLLLGSEHWSQAWPIARSRSAITPFQVRSRSPR